jgi:hypothetical protein
MQADNGSFVYFMPGFQPSYSPYLPLTTIGVDGQYIDQQAYPSSPIFQPSISSPGYYPTTLPYGELVPSPYVWDPSLHAGDGSFGNSSAGVPEFLGPKANLSSPSHTHAPLSKSFSGFSNPSDIRSTLSSLDVSSGHGMHKPLKLVNKVFWFFVLCGVMSFPPEAMLMNFEMIFRPFLMAHLSSQICSPKVIYPILSSRLTIKGRVDCSIQTVQLI